MSRKQITWLGLALGLAALVACNDVVGPGESWKVGGTVTGTWGGPHIEMVADQTGAALEFDCAAGMIDGRLVLDTQGNGVETGTFTFGRGGPYHVGEEPDMHPALYRAHVQGHTMALTIRITDTGQVFGPYTLRRGERGNVYLCQ